MQTKAFCIFASLCSAAVVPYTLFKYYEKQNTQSPLSEPINLVGEDNSELQELDSFFTTYCRKVHETMIVCKNREKFPWPEFYFVDKSEDPSKPQKIQSFIFSMVDKVPVLEFVLEQGQKKRIDGFPAGLGFEFFNKVALVPDADCIEFDNSEAGGGTQNIPNSIACKEDRGTLGGNWVTMPLSNKSN